HHGTPCIGLWQNDERGQGDNDKGLQLVTYLFNIGLNITYEFCKGEGRGYFRKFSRLQGKSANGVPGGRPVDGLSEKEEAQDRDQGNDIDEAGKAFVEFGFDGEDHRDEQDAEQDPEQLFSVDLVQVQQGGGAVGQGSGINVHPSYKNK